MTLTHGELKCLRDSNMELLRIVCMVMILNLHTFFLPSSNAYSLWRLADFFREATSISAVPIFVIISGYFGINYSHKKLIALLFNVLYWTILGYAVCVILGVAEFSLINIVKRIYLMFLSYWFITSYIGLLLLAPLVNSWLEHTNKTSIYKWLIILYAFAFFCQFVNYPDFRAGGSIISFIWLYVLGQAIRNYDWSNKILHYFRWYGLAVIWLFVTILIEL